MVWNTGKLIAGPLANDNYDYILTGLSSSMIYQYRAYMIVDGVEYYGNILTGVTCNETLTSPSILTGGLQISTLTPTSFSVSNNIITSSGNTSISEYGLLYTQESAWGNDAGLVISNNPLHNTKYVGVTCVTSIPFTYTADVINLTPNTTTFYRTYAKNAAGVVYGDIKNQITAPIYRNVSIDNIVQNVCDNYVMTSGVLTKPIVGESYCAQISYMMSGNGKGSNIIYVECNGNKVWCVTSSSCTSSTCIFGNVLVNSNDCITLYANSIAVCGIRDSTISVDCIVNNVGTYSLGEPSELFSSVVI